MSEYISGHRLVIHAENRVFTVCEIAPYAQRHNLVEGNIKYREAGLHKKGTVHSSGDGVIVHVPECQNSSCDKCEVAIVWQNNWNLQHPPQSD